MFGKKASYTISRNGIVELKKEGALGQLQYEMLVYIRETEGDLVEKNYKEESQTYVADGNVSEYKLSFKGENNKELIEIHSIEIIEEDSIVAVEEEVTLYFAVFDESEDAYLEGLTSTEVDDLKNLCIELYENSEIIKNVELYQDDTIINIETDVDAKLIELGYQIREVSKGLYESLNIH